ncbi:MAG: DNA polymerase/3'-5' exonuclease PolX [Spirochaetota bacterium]
MPLHNRDVAGIFNKVADLLDIKGENQFRIRSYRNAARTISGLSGNVADMVGEGRDLTELPGIGKDLAGKIKEIVETGSLGQLEELEKKVPPDLLTLLQLSDLGPRRVQAINRELGVRTIDELEKAAREQRVRELEGFGEKTEQKILDDIERFRRRGGEQKRFLWVAAEEITVPLMAYLREAGEVDKIIAAGSYRRRQETVGDLDILVTCSESGPVMERFTGYEDVQRVVSRGETRSSVVLRSGFQVDLRVVPEESYGAALHYFTGSKAHNVAIRTRGVKRGLKINEYGVFRDEDRVGGRTEEEVYDLVGLPYIQPELREGRGEVEAAEDGRLPRLVEPGDIRGDLQMHTTDTDGKYSLEEMARAAQDMGYEYIAVTDHSRRVTMAKGLDEKRLAGQIERIDRLNRELEGFTVLKSIEVDILEDGSLDLSGDILEKLDLVTCSIHYNRNLSLEKMTDRILRAMDNPCFNILGHPTGRIIGSRDPYELDLERIMRAAVERGCYMEVNADPERLDLSDIHCKMAKDLGLKLTISTDAHSTSGLHNMRLGVAQARRGWLEAEDILNTRPLEELRRLLKRG